MIDYQDKYQATVNILSEWTSKQGHEKCHYHQDLFIKLAELYDVTIPEHLKGLPSLCEFQAGCQAYQNLLFGRSDNVEN